MLNSVYNNWHRHYKFKFLDIAVNYNVKGHGIVLYYIKHYHIACNYFSFQNMKINILFFILLKYASIFAQSESVYLSLGKPHFPDKTTDNNFSLGLQYQNRFSSVFAYDIVLEYQQSNNLPDFINNSEQLNEFLLSQNSNNIFDNANWSKVQLINLGTRINYMFVNNDKFLFNINGGLGYLLSQASIHNLKSINFNIDTGEILSYTNSIDKGKLNSFYYSIGLQFQYTFYKNYFLGINPYYLMPFDDDQFFKTPVYPNLYNATINLGTKF